MPCGHRVPPSYTVWTLPLLQVSLIGQYYQIIQGKIKASVKSDKRLSQVREKSRSYFLFKIREFGNVKEKLQILINAMKKKERKKNICQGIWKLTFYG